ncbi:MAG: hypothetical protein HY461_03220 [Parcubacteria group bacterium]|nr:hypothetical protein [Parcubacteria group bacterium]
MPKKSAASIREHKIHFYRQIAFTFIGAALVVLLGLIYFSLSQAVIIVTPTLEKVTADFNVLVRADTDQTEQGVKARMVSTEVEIEKSGPAELLAEGQPQQAVGAVTIRNTSRTAQPLVATTRLLSEQGVLFRLRKAVTVPAQGSVEAEVYADKAGKEGEIAPTRFSVPGLNQARQQEVYANSTKAMTGGTKSVYKVTKKAIDEVVAAAKEGLITKAKTQIAAAGTTFDETPAIEWVNIVTQEITPAEGTDAATLTVKIKAQAVFVLADEASLLALAQKQLYETTSLGYELSSSDEGSFTYSIANFDAEKKTAQLRLLLQGNRRISTNNPLLDPSNFVGMKPAAVKDQLEAEGGIESVDVQLRPFWLRRLPRLVDHIYVQFAS